MKKKISILYIYIYILNESTFLVYLIQSSPHFTHKNKKTKNKILYIYKILSQKT